MDWNKFDIPTQKLLIVIMARSLKPIEFSVGYIIPMNVDSFSRVRVAIIKSNLHI